jgi:hypothetical protein
MKCRSLITVLIFLLTFAGCATRKATRPAGPDLSAAITANQGIIESLTAAQQDDKAVKQAITALQESNLALHKLHGDMRSNLDRADYKTSILLK